MADNNEDTAWPGGLTVEAENDDSDDNVGRQLEANHSKNRGLPLFFPTDSYPSYLYDLSQTSCSCALKVWITLV